jgi:CheY-like chemotaxis protein
MVEAENGEEAIASAQASRPDLILMDYPAADPRRLRGDAAAQHRVRRSKSMRQISKKARCCNAQAASATGQIPPY